jgi:hypothetical protein
VLDGKKSRDVVLLSCLFLALLFFFKDALLGARTLIWDAADYFYPIFFNVSATLRHGEIPLWNPFLFNGFPTIANIEAQVFYPVNLLFLPFTSFTPYVVHLKLILHYFLGGAFMYLLAGYFLENRWARLLSAMVYMLAGFMVGHFEHVTIIEVLAWLPLIFLFLEKALRERKLAHGVFAGFFFGISLLAGHPQTSHGIGFILAVHTIYRTATLSVQERKKGFWFFSVSVLAICIITGILLAAVQILPTYELAKESSRGNPLSFAFSAASAQLSLRDAVLLFVPNYFGALTGPYWGDIDISQNIFYIGITPLMLIGLALLFSRKNSDVPYFFVMGAFFLLLSLGENSPVYRIFFRYVPGFNYFRGPANTIFLFTFFAALLSGHGLNALIGHSHKKTSVYIYLGIFSLLGLALYAFSPAPPDGIALEAVKNMQNGFIGLVCLLFLSALVIIAAVSYPRLRNACCLILLLLTYTDLSVNFSDAITLGVKAAPSIYEQEPGIATAIKKHAGIVLSDGPDTALNDSEVKNGLFRVYTKPEGVRGAAVFGFNRAMLFRIFLLEGFEPLELHRHRKLIDTLSAKNMDNLLKITNARYITSLEGQRVNVAYYPSHFPKVYIVPNARFIDNDDRVLEELAAFDPGKEVIISGRGQDISGRNVGAGDWNADVITYAGNEIQVRTRSRKDGFLVFSDTYYPGWQAWVDGAERPVMRANYDFKAIFLPYGEHTVVFRFHDRYLKSGMFISVGCVFLVGFVFLLPHFVKKPGAGTNRN